MKHHLLFSVFALSCTVSFAQLKVKPNGSTESYIYVKNELLYVKGPIDLDKNSNSQTEPSIYLRGSGQLLQGEAATNDGDGMLSVMQKTDPTNAFFYYYWGAPVGEPRSDYNGNRNFGVKNIYEPLSGEFGRSARQAATTTAREGIKSPLTISTRWLYTLMSPGTEAAANYVRINSDYDVVPGYGFTMKGVGLTNTEQWYDFRGRPHNGTFAVSVRGYTTNGEPQMTLVGNPYPSVIDLNKFFHDTDNGDLEAIWFYDEDRFIATPSHNYSGKPFGYGAWAPGGADPTGTNKGTFTAPPFSIWRQDGSSAPLPGDPAGRNNPDRRYAAIGQGFMIIGRENIPGTSAVNIKNAHRVYRKNNTDVNFYRGVVNSEDLETSETAGKAINNNYVPTTSAEDSRSHMRLYVTFDRNFTRDLVLSFSDEATDGFDRGYDAITTGGMASDAAFLISREAGIELPHVINAIPYQQGKRVPLSLKLNKRSRVDVKVAEELNKPYANAYLYDYDTEIYYPLDNQNRRGISLDLGAGTYNDRFFIVFEKLDIIPWKGEDVETFKSQVNIFQNNQQQQLEIRNPERHEIKALSVYDMSGKEVIRKSNLGSSTNHSFYTGNLSDGVYLIKLITVDDIPVDYKAVIYNR